MVRVFTIIFRLSGIHGEFKISALPNFYCALEADNETDKGSYVNGNETQMANTRALTVYANMSCDLQISSLSFSQVGISVVAGNMTGLDYIYVERLGSITVCSERFVAFFGPLEQCTVYFANDIIQLHFRGDFALRITDLIFEKDHLSGCPEDTNQQEVVLGALEGQTSNCKHVKGFRAKIQCFDKAHGWLVAEELGDENGHLTFRSSTRCDMQCPENCSCILTDRQVIYNCSQNIHQLDQNYTSFVVFSNDVSYLDLSENSITALMNQSFTNIGKHIKYLDLSSNLLSSLPLGLFDNFTILVYLDLDENRITKLDVGLFVHLDRLVYLDLDSNSLTELDVGLFDKLYSLHFLELDDNAITSLDVGLFDDLLNMTAVDLDNNALTALGIGLFDKLHHLDFLDLESNALTTLDPGLLDHLHKLTFLDLINNTLIELSSGVFNKLYSLRYLYLYINRIESVKENTFSNLTRLTHLSLAKNQLSTLPFNLFDDLLRLTHLDLSLNSLQSIPRLGHMIFLRRIDLHGNPLIKITQNMLNGVPSTAVVFVDKPEICFCYLKSSSDTCFYTIKPSPYLTCSWLLSLTLLSVFLWIIGCSAFLGNMFVLWCKQFKEEAINKVQSFFLSNLAMSDLLMGIYMIIIASADVYYGDYFPMNAEKWRSSIMCKCAGTLAITSSEASVLFVTLISIDRFITIQFPYSRHKLDVKSTKIISLIVWIFSLVLGLVASSLSGKNSDFYDNSHVCIGLPLAQLIVTDTEATEAEHINYWQDSLTVRIVKGSHKRPGLYFSVAVFIALNMVCFVLILACYIGIIRAVFQVSKAASRQREMVEEIRMTIKVSAIVLTDFFCWFPICLIGALVQIGVVELPNSVFAWVVTLVLPINSAINPFLYTLITLISAKCSKGTTKPEK